LCNKYQGEPLNEKKKDIKHMSKFKGIPTHEFKQIFPERLL